MPRTAEYSIKGYLFQFLKYLSEVLASEKGSNVYIEGSIEDVDVHSAGLSKAIQCKYHEQVTNYSLSKIYKPILLMLDHFHNNKSSETHVEYHLFCFFPDKSGIVELTISELDAALKSSNASLAPIIKRLQGEINVTKFISQLRIEFGPSVSELEGQVISALVSEGFSKEDVRSLIFPAALQKVVDLGTRTNISERTIERSKLIIELKDAKSIAYTRWIRESSAREDVLKRIRRDLRVSLNQNHRRRCFLINQDGVADFEQRIVTFLADYANKYVFKKVHVDPPIFLFSGIEDITWIEDRLLDKDIASSTALITPDRVRVDRIFRMPMVVTKQGKTQFEFRIRLAKLNHIENILQYHPHDVFFVNDVSGQTYAPDAEQYRFDIETLRELEFLLRMRDSHV